MSYNEAQSIAIAHHKGPMLVLAGPGSGKTHVITNRISMLIKKYGVKPEEILVISFTKFSANEMKERFLKSSEEVPVTFGTFHAIFYGILRWAYSINGNNILLEHEKRRLIAEIIASDEFDESIEIELDEEDDLIDNIIKQISIVKGDALKIEDYEAKNIPKNAFRKIFKYYEDARKKYRKLDFDDMISQCYFLLAKDEKIRKLWQDRYKYILIDEFQDINQMQFDTIKLITGNRRNLFVVGDDDQSIYGFRGARPEIMLSFKDEFPDVKEVTLEKNYRSSKSIVRGASKVIRNNVNRFPKEINTDNEEGKGIHIQEVLDQNEECIYILNKIQENKNNGIAYEKNCIIFRTNHDARAIASKLVEYNVPFQLKEQIPNLYEHFIAKNIITYMKLSRGDVTRQNLLEVINKPNRFVSRQALDNREASFEALIDFYDDKDWMQDRIHQFELDLRVMKNLTPYAFIEYLKNKIGYLAYIKEYAEYRNINANELIEVLDEISEQAKGYKSVNEWIEFVEEYKKKIHLANQNKEKKTRGVNMHTMHGSKGLEFEHVFIIQCNEEVTPSKKAKMTSEIEEERRMFYVAMTRAKKELTLVYVKQKHGKNLSSSRFINELLI